ncbi:hypothetical protein GF359_02125 [candidate division WOR-3 bacterium]|uniref:FlgD/Vpr Ig-like domain-containing protein n=1 Tax=candidate division WOR-3 bacterium TaxID=2052148 RepID=A0A9D5QDF3_UNCW3|nr:hypothetical protein [candidate division WOR-3 bacterium]MBD3363990.1 hypothetical protein [candidate division WOR-3 bacterium]
MRIILLILNVLIAANGYTPSTLLVPPFKHTLGYNRVNKFYLSLFLGGTFKFEDPQGITGVRLAMYDDTTTSRDDDLVALFATHSGACEILYNVEFDRLERYGEKGSGTGQFRSPMGLAVTPGGDLYVADAGNNRIVHLKYLEDGSLEWKGTIGSDFNHPTDVAVDSRGNVYVTDEGNNRVAVYNPDGSTRSIWTRDIFKPSSIAVIDRDDPDNENNDNFAVVIDDRHRRISKFDLYGDVKTQLTYKEMGYEKVRFAYVAIDRSGSVYVTDMHNHQVHKFDNRLWYIISIGREGIDDYEFYSPRGIFINRPTGQVFIVEQEGGQYYWIGADGFIAGCFPNPFHVVRGTTISIYLTEASTLTLNIYDENGLLVREIPKKKYPIGEVLIVWDGTNLHGQKVSSGNYTVKVELQPVNASRRYFTKELETTVRCIAP